jgi:RHS repeat-associated protein
MNLNCVTSQGDSSPMHFTGKQRDAETGLDYFGARFDASTLGRFMTPDPLMNSGHPWNPQSWNRYTYTLNNPLSFTDPTGLWVWGKCTGDATTCDKEKQRFRDSVTKAEESLKGLDPKSKEAKALASALKKIGEEGKGDLKVNFGDAGETNGRPNMGNTVGHNITINYDAVDQAAKDWNLNPSEAADLDAGVTTHKGTHAFGNGPFGFLQGHLEQPAYYTESVTYQGLHNTDLILNLWNESWLKVDKDKLSIEADRENSIQNAIHPPKQDKSQ